MDLNIAASVQGRHMRGDQFALGVGKRRRAAQQYLMEGNERAAGFRERLEQVDQGGVAGQ